MNVETLKLELPSKLEEMFQLKFDNLIKVIEYLFNNNLVMIQETKDLKSKMKNLENIQSEFEELKEKTSSIEKTNEIINNTFSEIRDKVYKNDSKVTQFEIQMEKNKKIIDGHDTNINNLNRVVEENVKSIKEIQENLTITLGKMQRFEQEIKDIHKENVHTHELIEGNSNKIIEEHNINEKNFGRINGSLVEINESIYSLRNNIDKKNKNFDNCIGSMMNSISNLSSKSPNAHQNEENLYKLSMKELERQQEKFNSFLEEQKQSEDKRNKENDTFKKIIDSLRIDIQNINNKIVNISTKTEEESEEKKSKDNSMNKNSSEEPIEKVNEYIKKLTKSISTLPNREEFESLNRNTDARIKKLEELNNIGLRSLEANSKLRSSISAMGNGKIEDNSLDFSQLKNFAEKLKFSITTEINDNFKDMLKKEIKSLDISKNPQIEEIVKTVNQHNEEINNNNKTVIDLRKTIFAIEAEKKFNMLSSQVTKLEEDNERSKKKIFEIIKAIEGYEEFDDYGDETKYEPTSIKGKIELLEKSYNNILDRFIQLEAKNKSLSRELKEEIKSNLRIETLKTVSQFREKLEIFTRRFEEELKNKIDQMGLNNFEKRMNTKIYYDLKDKLNRNEMQKNNNVINRKIDSLENKISKTLVDTIIDLQMDEAPLIIKKTPNNLEICASCNQLIQKDKGYISNTEQNSLNSQTLQAMQTININKNHNNSNNNRFRKTFYGFNRAQNSMPKINNVMSLRKELPDINKHG